MGKLGNEPKDGVKQSFAIKDKWGGELVCSYDPTSALMQVAESVVQLFLDDKDGIKGEHAARLHQSFIELGLELKDTFDQRLKESLELGLWLAVVLTRADLAQVLLTEAPHWFPHNTAAQVRKEFLSLVEEKLKEAVRVPRPGRTRKITDDRFCEAVHLLKDEGKTITIGALSMKVGCQDSAIYKFLKKQRITLDEAISRCTPSLEK